MDLDYFRREYLQGGLRRKDLSPDPIQQFQTWLEQAIALGLGDPTAMVLGTAADDGQPSQRIVLLKQVDAEGFVFYTNYDSRKGQDLAANPKVSLLFPWNAMDRQVTVGGCAEKIPAEESQRYFRSRPRESQLAAWASAQSQAIADQETLMRQLREAERQFADGEIPCPKFWGGLRVRPRQLEFWQGGAGRLHDRFEYRLDRQGRWQIQRLAP